MNEFNKEWLNVGDDVVIHNSAGAFYTDEQIGKLFEKDGNK